MSLPSETKSVAVTTRHDIVIPLRKLLTDGGGMDAGWFLLDRIQIEDLRYVDGISATS
jgi:hypothetical protein